ncbi:MAG: hypothetical protein IJU40_06190, partial [Desulfovibrionaceae bacterium]|nr:hypothetical protein [Desulfovibrionaceae bacterium]
EALLNNSTAAKDDNIRDVEAALDLKEGSEILNAMDGSLSNIGILTATTKTGLTKMLRPLAADGWDAGHYETGVDNTSYAVFQHRSMQADGKEGDVDAILTVAKDSLLVEGETIEEYLNLSSNSSKEEGATKNLDNFVGLQASYETSENDELKTAMNELKYTID